MEVKNNEQTTQRRGRPRSKTIEQHGAKAAKRRAAIPPDTDRLLRIDAVCELISMSRAWAYDAIRKGNFPAGVKISTRARGWTASSIVSWIEERQAA